MPASASRDLGSGALRRHRHGLIDRRIGHQAQKLERSAAGIAELMYFVWHDQYTHAGSQWMFDIALQHHALPFQHEHFVLIGMAVFRRKSAWGNFELAHGKIRSAVFLVDQPAHAT